MKSKFVLLFLLADLCFASATVFAKYATTGTAIPGLEVSFFRFLVGFIVTGIIAFRSDISMKPNSIPLVIMRGVLNTVAVIFFFTAVKYTSITNANMLNMTAPAFIFLFAPLVTNETITWQMVCFLLLSFIGVWIVINPDFNHINHGDFVALLSGITGAWALLSLRKAREFDSTNLILFYVMVIGTIINGALLIPVFVIPDNKQLVFILVSAFLGFFGQICITSGYKYVEAGKASMVSSSRIVYAAILGYIFFTEMPTRYTIVGGLLIAIAIIGSAWMNKE